jgi:hypothetical protein
LTVITGSDIVFFVAGSSPPLDRYRDQELTLEALVEAAVRLLRRFDLRPGDGRVAEAMDARGIRYYQTLGVIDRPVRYDGRRAVYGYRHLLQVLAAKKLQQEGHPLQLIQQALAGRSTESLEWALSAASDQEPGEIRLPPPPVRVFDADPVAAAPRLVAAQVAPGVTVTVDPAVVGDPEAVVAAIGRALGRLRNGDSQD